MKLRLCIIFLVLVQTFRFQTTTGTSSKSSNASDEVALLSFKSLVDDPFGALAPWNASLPFCHWPGVTCGGRRRHPDRVSALDQIQLYSNKFSGTIPSTLGALRNLSSLLLGHNHLEAKDAHQWRFFAGLVNCTNLRKLDVSNNWLGGFLPGAITNLSRGLTWLGMNGNKISGSIPPEISNLAGLTTLDLCQNLFTGTVPATIGKLQMLQELHLSENMLSGEIPSEIGNLTLLITLYLHENQFSGTIPRTLGNCKKLTSLSLGYNKLSGTIPLEIIGITSFSKYLSFSNNELTGPLPSEVGGLINLETMDVSNNKLYGEIPGTLGDCSIMRFLAMEGNLFRGSIPSSFSQLKGLQELDLSRNNLSGQVPKFFADFRNLDNLNLSFNDLEGEVPKGGALSNLTATSLLGNYKLCGGSPGFDLPPCSIETSKRKSSNKLIKIISAVATALCVIFFSCGLIALCWTKKSRRRSDVIGDKDTQMPVSYSDLAKATDEFSADNLIGTGSFGSVYRADMKFGKLDAVAVKVINHQQRGAAKTFVAECEALRNVRHRNLVRILTTCSSVDFRGSDFRAFVFEFMPNGSLEKWLHPEEGKEDLRPRLSLLQRLNIAIDVASALDYLHHYADVPIVHCDLKPSNVLLDDDMVAHVGDFGLARFLNKTIDETSIGSSGLLGTIGYVPPEYAITNKVSTKGDVYSYGILVLEMFTGKKPTDHAFTEEDTNLHKFVEAAFPGRVMDIVDADILLDDEDAGDDKDDTTRGSMFERRRANVRELLASVLRVGLSCSKELQSGRMQMGDVVKELVAAKYAFVSDESHEEKYI